MSNLTMVDVTRYQILGHAHVLAVRQAELSAVMQIVEQCGASPELTQAITLLGNRMRDLQSGIENACREAIGESGDD